MTGLGELLAAGRRRLVRAGIASAPLDARLLAAHAFGRAPESLFGRNGEQGAPPAAAAAFAALLDRRLAGEPVSRLIGRREFWSLEFELTPATLDPRPDSETLVEAVLGAVADRARPWSILDLGTGSGCLLLALLHELPEATGLGVDIDPACCVVAGRNAARLGLGARAAFRVGDWAAGLDRRFDILVCNPPYIADGEIADLAPEVRRFDPPAALSGGPDGLRHYRGLAGQLPGLLRPGGLAFLELGAGQDAAVARIMAGAGLRPHDLRRDLGGRPRCLVLETGSRNYGENRLGNGCEAV